MKESKILEIQSKRRSDTFSFGGRGSMYSSLAQSSMMLTPTDLIDCFDRMEKIRNNQLTLKCDVCCY